MYVILNAIQHAWKANDPQVHETDLPLQDVRRKMHFCTSPKLFMRLDGVQNSFSFNFPHGKEILQDALQLRQCFNAKATKCAVMTTHTSRVTK